MSTPASVPVHARPLQFKGGPHGVLLFHGLSSSPLELQLLARGLYRAGYTVHVPVIDGYTTGMTGHQGATVDQWVARAQQELERMLEQCETVSVGGLCLGAVMALRLAALNPERVCTVLGLSTALHYDGWGNPWYAPLLPLGRYLPFAGRIRIRERSPFGLKDERMRGWIERQMREAKNSDAGAASLRVSELLKARELIALTRRSLPKITAPVLLLHAVEDECATPRSSHEVAARVQSRDVHLVLLHDSYHMISMDREKERVLTEMVQFLASRQTLPSSKPDPTPVPPLAYAFT